MCLSLWFLEFDSRVVCVIRSCQHGFDRAQSVPSAFVILKTSLIRLEACNPSIHRYNELEANPLHTLASLSP